MAASAPVFLASTAPLANCSAITVRRLTGWKARPAAVCRPIAVCRLPSAVYLSSIVHRAVTVRRPHSFIRSPVFVDGHLHRPLSIAPLPSAIPIRLFVPLYSLTVTPTVHRPAAVCRLRSIDRP